MHVKTHLQNHRIRLVVARHVHCLHRFTIVCMHVALVWATRYRKVAHRAMFLHVGQVPASGNAFVEMVTDKCTSTTFLLVETCAGTCTWKASLTGRYSPAKRGHHSTAKWTLSSTSSSGEVQILKTFESPTSVSILQYCFNRKGQHLCKQKTPASPSDLQPPPACSINWWPLARTRHSGPPHPTLLMVPAREPDLYLAGLYLTWGKVPSCIRQSMVHTSAKISTSVKQASLFLASGPN